MPPINRVAADVKASVQDALSKQASDAAGDDDDAADGAEQQPESQGKEEQKE